MTVVTADDVQGGEERARGNLDVMASEAECNAVLARGAGRGWTDTPSGEGTIIPAGEPGGFIANWVIDQNFRNSGFDVFITIVTPFPEHDKENNGVHWFIPGEPGE